MGKWTATVTDKYRDGANLNIVAEITYTDGVTTIVERFFGVDITDAAIAEQARKRIRNQSRLSPRYIPIGPPAPASVA